MNDDRFDIRVAFGSDRVSREFRIRGCENRGLGVVNVRVFDERQVAGAPGHRDVEMVFHAASHRAIANT